MIIAGILGESISGRWYWAVTASLLALLAVAAGAGVLVSQSAKRRSRLPAAAGVYSWNWTTDAGRDAYVAAGNMRITNVTRKSGPGGMLAVCLAALILAVGGTAYFGNEPGGRFYYPPSAEPGDGSFTGWTAAAAIDEKDSATGDHVVQTVSFQSPVPLSQVPEAQSLIQISGCGLGPVSDPVSRDLAVPFRIISTLKSDQQVQVSLMLAPGNLTDASGNTDGLVSSPADVAVGEYQGTPACGETAALTLSPGEGPVTYYGWLIFPGAVSPDYPRGNTLDLGETFAQLELALTMQQSFDNVSESGPWVCASNSDSSAGAFIHIGGTMVAGEQCNGRNLSAPLELGI
jgi:hypothetical protein